MKTKLMIWIIIFSILTCLQGCKDIDKYKYDFIKNSITNPDDFDNILDKVPFKKDLFIEVYYHNEATKKNIIELLKQANYLLLKEGYTSYEMKSDRENKMNLEQKSIKHWITLHSKHFDSYYITFIWTLVNNEWILSGITTESRSLD